MSGEHFRQRQPIHLRHVQIEQDHAIGITGLLRPAHRVERIRAAVRGVTTHAPTLRIELHEAPVGAVVIDCKDAQPVEHVHGRLPRWQL